MATASFGKERGVGGPRSVTLAETPVGVQLEVTNTWANTRKGNPTIVVNISPASITSLPKTQLTTGTVVDLVSNESVRVNSNTGGRAFVATSLMSLKAGVSYVAMARFANVVLGGTASSNRLGIALTTTTNIVAGSTSSIAAAIDGLFAIVFQFSVDSSVGVRLGSGLSSASSGNSADISDFCIYRLPEFIGVNEAIPPPIGLYKPVYRRGLAFSTVFANTYSSVGLVTEAAMTVPLTETPSKYRVGCYVSDSFGNDSGDWPDYLAQTYGYSMFGGSWSGANMVYFKARALDVFLRTDVGFTGDAEPDFAICQSSLNSANSGYTADAMLGDMEDIILLAQFAGLTAFVTNMTPYGTTMSLAKETELLAYNAALPELCYRLGAKLIDVYSLVSDPSNRKNLLPAYTSDEIHLNAAGVAVYAEAVNLAISQARQTFAANFKLLNQVIQAVISSVTRYL